MQMPKKRIAVLVSGGGTNLQAILDGVKSGAIDQGEVVLVLSSNRNAYALERARANGVPTKVIDKAQYPDPAVRNQAIRMALDEVQADLVVLAGYLSILDDQVIGPYRGRILNIHPSLIPRHCGPGFYGKNVHQSVLASGEDRSGATVHYVEEGVDTGEIIAQETVPVLEGDTVDDLAARVLVLEHALLVKTIAQLCRGKESSNASTDQCFR